MKGRSDECGEGEEHLLSIFVARKHTWHTWNATRSQLLHSTTHGFVIGGGLDIKVLVIHIQPEIRYTRWGSEHFFDPTGLLHSNQNQGEFLLGIEF